MRIVLQALLVAVVGPAIVHASEPLLGLQVGGARIEAEYARSPAERERGLMERTEMAADHGMLFRFDDFRRHCLWMKNTPLPLDMIFIDADGVIARIAEDTTPFSETIIPSVAPVRYVLELNGGTAAQRGIAAGDKVRHRVIGK